MEKAVQTHFKLWLLSAVLITSMTLSAQTRTFVYVSNADSNDLNVFRFNPKTGAMSPIEKASLSGQPGFSTPMAVSPDKRFLYVANRTKPYTVATFAIAKATGKLTRLADGPLEDAMAYVFVDRSGHFLLSASYTGNQVTVNPIGPDGLVGAPQQTIVNVPKAHSIQTDPANRFAFVPSLASDKVRQFKFDATNGMLSPNSPDAMNVLPEDGPRHFVFHPNGKIVYLVCETSATLYTYDYDPQTGVLKQKQSLSFKVKNYLYGNKDSWYAADIHITPNGQFLYASQRSASTIAAFRVDPATGLVSLIGQFPTETQPRSFHIDPSGRYLLSAGQASDHVAVHAIDQKSGELTFLKRYPAGKNPNWIEFVTLP
jgi:6-phosphogluconolactonase